ncbi:MAG: class I SAM-dependent methyltransferase [Dehalococcoidia bacterium]|nr:class I SAM-dependent methyltransferase [Dehalococcoidia bacterium]
MEDTKGLWDRMWERKTDTLTDKDILYMVDETKLEYTLSILPDPSRQALRTVEIGCGSARLSCFLAAHEFRATCLDYSEGALRVARANFRLLHVDGDFLLSDVRHLPLADGSFDVVLSTGLLEHFADPQPIVAEMTRILKPGGYFISDIVPERLLALYQCVHHLTGLFYSIVAWMQRRRYERMYERALSKRDIIHLLSFSGLQEIGIFAAGVVPPPLVLPSFTPFKDRIKTGYNGFIYRLKPFFKSLDKTVIADIFGLYYYVHARKPVTPCTGTRHANTRIATQ